MFPYISSNVNEGGDDGGGSPMTAHLIDTSESAGNSRRFSLCGLMLKLNKSNLSSPKIYKYEFIKFIFLSIYWNFLIY